MGFPGTGQPPPALPGCSSLVPLWDRGGSRARSEPLKEGRMTEPSGRQEAHSLGRGGPLGKQCSGWRVLQAVPLSVAPES